MDSRRAARESVAALLFATIPTFAAVYDYEVLDSSGLSPYATVHSDGTWNGPGRTLGADQRQHALFITLYWLRDADATEDGLDDLSQNVYSVIEANKMLLGVWDSLELDEAFSQLGYSEPTDGVIYRFERIRVIIW